MTYGAFLIGHPLFWSALVGICLGGALATATRDARRDPRPERARSRKWTAAALWTTVGVVAATCGILVPDGLTFFGLPSLYVGAAALALIAMALRFPRAAGIPVFFILAAATVLGPLLMRPFVPMRDAGVAATVQLLAVDQSGAYVEVNDRTPGAGPAPQVISIGDPTGDPTVVARAHLLQISDYLFFLGARGGVALDALRTATAEVTASSGGDAVTLYSGMQFIERAIDVMPLLTLTTVESEPVRLSLLEGYEIVGLPDGSVQMRRVVASE
ncbi:MAG: hypothetical protein KOO61_09255 [Spirochaetales bacterium]|nr:hypothetical protein [Spirochaetales bacterium]